eukprot:jgi/Mesvir1/10268/Mv07819-RA.1
MSAMSLADVGNAELSEEEREKKIQEALDCPCVADLRDGPCGTTFVQAFSCFLRNNDDSDKSVLACGDSFAMLQECIGANAEHFEELLRRGKEEGEGEEAGRGKEGEASGAPADASRNGADAASATDASTSGANMPGGGHASTASAGGERTAGTSGDAPGGVHEQGQTHQSSYENQAQQQEPQQAGS